MSPTPARPRRVAIVNQFYTPDLSPTAHLAHSLAEHLQAGGDEVTVITSWSKYATTDRRRTETPTTTKVRRVWVPGTEQSSPYRRIVLGRSARDAGAPASKRRGEALRTSDHLWTLASTAWALVRLERQDVVISMTTPPFVIGAAVLHKLRHRARRPPPALVLWSMDCYPQVVERLDRPRRGWKGLLPGIGRRSVLSRTLHAFNRWAFRHVDGFVALDEAMVEQLAIDVAPDRHAEIAVIPNWERRDVTEPGVAPADMFAKLGASGSFVVLYMGNLGSGHEFETMIGAAEELRDADVRWVMLGSGSDNPGLLRALQYHQVADVVHLLPYVPKEETPGYLAGGSVGLVVLEDDAAGVMSPSKIHSYLAAGLPIAYVGPRRSNVDEAIERFGCGFRVRPGDASSLAAELRRLADDPTSLDEMRTRARTAFEQAYTDEVGVASWERLLDRVVARASTRGGDPRTRTIA